MTVDDISCDCSRSCLGSCKWRGPGLAGSGFAAVYIPKGIAADEERSLRTRLGLICRHGIDVRTTRNGRCPACRVASGGSGA